MNQICEDIIIIDTKSLLLLAQFSDLLSHTHLSFIVHLDSNGHLLLNKLKTQIKLMKLEP